MPKTIKDSKPIKKDKMKRNYLIALAPAGLMVTSLVATAGAKSSKMKMTTPIPPEVTTPDTVKTRLGTLTGLPGDAPFLCLHPYPHSCFYSLRPYHQLQAPHPKII
ncbi:MAG: hypothetical protein JRJ43_02495 [Deltaproteobacteria bacterium]|nr:hypothetical protein [Deltaproteobacteria bacterium]